MTILGKGVGVLAKGIGSGSPSFVMEERPDPEIIHPFKVTARRVSNGSIEVRVRAGTVNNIVPLIGDKTLDDPAVEPLVIGDAATWDIYVRAESASPPIFTPDTLDVIINERVGAGLSDTNTYGYLRLASIVVADVGGLSITSINQYVYASQVLVRAKPGTATALWFWSSR
jgi:hypothetical protein